MNHFLPNMQLLRGEQQQQISLFLEKTKKTKSETLLLRLFMRESKQRIEWNLMKYNSHTPKSETHRTNAIILFFL